MMDLSIFKKTIEKVGRITLKQTEQPDDLELLLQECKAKLPSVNIELVSKAYHWCIEAHKNKIRKSGEEYWKHPIAVARIVIHEIHLDDISVISALLHDINHFGEKYTLEDIRSEFGETVAEIVDGVSKIQNIEAQKIHQLENYRKLLLSLFKDVRIILIKLADRLHNMRTLEFLEPSKQRMISEETLEIYAPFAHRFGLGNIKWELEDLAFKHLNREIYNEITGKLQLNRRQREEYVREFIKPVELNLKNDTIFKANKISFEISGRAKHIYSIYHKTLAREKPVEELYDLFAVRIIIDSDDIHFCYIAFYVISQIYRLVPGTYKDYIANPKMNGYKSIHSAFLGKDDKMVEVQIRTRSMHEISEKGVAAHFKYKRGLLPAESVLENIGYEDWLDAVRDIFENAADENPEELLEKVKKNLVMDEIYVFTPSNEFKTFPRDATPLDFAYSIHTDIGNHCVGAKVNSRIVPLNHKLNSGDIIEILTSKTQKPDISWLKYVVTHKAKSGIQKYLKDESKRISDDGRVKWEQLLKYLGIEPAQVNPDIILDFLKLTDMNELFRAISLNNYERTFLFDVIYKCTDIRIPETKNTADTIPKTKATRKDNQKEINLPVRPATCCYPVRGDNVISYIDPGKEIVIHRIECKKSRKELDIGSRSKFNFDWTLSSDSSFTSKLLIHGKQDPSIISEITAVVLSETSISIKAIKFDNIDDEFTGNITLLVPNTELLNSLINQVKNLKGIEKAERIVKE